ncbi:MAG: hypothetical protein FWF59_11270, partial [Turicibacter sp.]|nr:hypothetical protein [Turicibacter sp.]
HKLLCSLLSYDIISNDSEILLFEVSDFYTTIKPLMGVSQTNRLIGIISDITVLGEKIDRKIVVTKDRSGSSKAELILN